MRKVTTISGRAYPLGRDNIDTDLIIGAAHLKTLTRSGLGRHAFETLRQKPGNVFDDPAFVGAPILIAGATFGCGSSREHAAWALADLGIEAVIATSFSDIFAGNAFKNGILVAELEAHDVERLLGVAREHPLTIDLATMRISTPAGDEIGFELDAFRRDCLLNGLDEIALTLADEPSIAAFEASHVPPWRKSSVAC